MKIDPFRTTVVVAILAFAVVVIHDIMAKRSYERTVEFARKFDWQRENERWEKGFRDTQPTHNEIEIEYRATHKPETWLF